MSNLTITVVGTGYVGLSLAVLLAQRNRVLAVDIVREKIELINRGISPIQDKEIERFLREEQLDLKATLDAEQAYRAADLVVVATPTNYDPEKNAFDTAQVDSVIEQVLRCNDRATIIIRSTVPIGYTEAIRQKTGCDRILFSPEFLREGNALYDNLHPSRIIVGCDTGSDQQRLAAQRFAGLLQEASLSRDTKTRIMGCSEAESVKLFSNAYLAMRVAYFNELDTFCEIRKLDTKSVIEGIGLDPRIGNAYNNPSFGYGGYCLPKDTKQLLSEFDGVDENLIQAIVSSNETRERFVADRVLALVGRRQPNHPLTIGAYRLTMKNGSDNFRQSSIQAVMRILRDRGCHVVVYEPTVTADAFEGYPVIRDLEAFKSACDAIIANRNSDELADEAEKVYSRDIYHRD